MPDLGQFVPGQSGNPAGRPPKDPLTAKEEIELTHIILMGKKDLELAYDLIIGSIGAVLIAGPWLHANVLMPVINTVLVVVETVWGGIEDARNTVAGTLADVKEDPIGVAIAVAKAQSPAFQVAKFLKEKFL